MLNNNYQKAVFISSALHFYESKDEFFGDAWYCEDRKLLVQFGNFDCSAEFELDLGEYSIEGALHDFDEKAAEKFAGSPTFYRYYNIMYGYIMCLCIMFENMN